MPEAQHDTSTTPQGKNGPGPGLSPGSGSTGGPAPEPRSLLPWVISGVVVLLVLGALLLAGRHQAPPNPGGAGLAPADPYASQLTIGNVKMSESSNLSGGKVTYLDGEIVNHGSQTVRGITVQVAFRNALKQIAQKETMPLNLIRMREPYVDTQPVSAAPIAPGGSREFRLIFDHVTADWDQEYPEVRIIEVTAK